MNTSQKIVEFVGDIQYKDIPDDCISKAKDCLLDYIGVTLAGSAQESARIIKEYCRQLGGSPESTVIESALKTFPAGAALANGTMGHLLDYDDLNRQLPHPSVCIFPSILAVGEWKKSSGKDILAAFVLGYEVACEIASVVEPHHSQRGWHSSATVGTFGSVLGVSKLLQLSTQNMLYSVGIAASLTSGLKRNFGTLTKALHAGKAAENGVVAALLAQKGFTSDPTILEGKKGFCHIFSGQYDLKEAVNKLDTFVSIRQGGFKLYPCCGSAAAALDALLFMIEKYSINIDGIVQVQVGSVPLVVDDLVYRQPKSVYEAKFSMNFLAALALCEKEVSLENLVEEKLGDPRIRKLMKKVTLSVDSEMAQAGYRGTWSARVKVKMKEGSEFSERVDIPRGQPENPMSPSQLIGKYQRCARYVLSEERINQSLDWITHLEKLEDISSLMSVIA